MANVTDPLARPIHGTNPQNLIEYITRQRIYDSQFWKESCFGLTAADVAEKAAIDLHAIGGSYGGNSKPTRFLCLVLKMLQIQPEDDIIDALIANKNFKYVRALGVFYLRLTGRPSDIYQKLEPLYNDYRKLKFRNPSDWSLIRMDMFIDQLLIDERVCGISLPRLPKRKVLVDAGYLDGPRHSVIYDMLNIFDQDDCVSQDERYRRSLTGVENIKAQLKTMSESGNQDAMAALVERGFDPIKETKRISASSSLQIDSDSLRMMKKRKPSNGDKPKKKKNKFGSLFKSSTITTSNQFNGEDDQCHNTYNATTTEDKDWDNERVRLGLKPLKR